jgi:hypothetical protein
MFILPVGLNVCAQALGKQLKNGMRNAANAIRVALEVRHSPETIGHMANSLGARSNRAPGQTVEVLQIKDSNCKG